MDRGDWWATVHVVAKSRTWLSDFHFHLNIILIWFTGLDFSHYRLRFSSVSECVFHCIWWIFYFRYTHFPYTYLYCLLTSSLWVTKSLLYIGWSHLSLFLCEKISVSVVTMQLIAVSKSVFQFGIIVLWCLSMFFGKLWSQIQFLISSLKSNMIESDLNGSRLWSD